VLLCGIASVLVLFEDRNELVFYWLAAFVFVVGSLLDVLDGALARAGGKTTPFGAFLDSTTDRISEGFMLTAIAVRPRTSPPTRLRRRRNGRRSRGRSSSRTTRAKAEALGLRGDVGIGSRAERVRRHYRRARARTVGRAPLVRSCSSPPRRGSPSLRGSCTSASN